MRYDANQLSMLPEDEFMTYYKRYVAFYRGLPDEQKRAENQYASIVKNEYTARKQRAQQSMPLNFEVPETPAYSEPSPPQQTRKPKKNGGCLKVALIIIAIFLVLIIVIAALGSGAQSSGSSNSSRNISSSAPAETPSPTPSIAPTYEATAQSMQQLFEDSFDFAYSDLSCTMQDEDGANVCTVVYKDNEAAWDESAIVRQVLSTFIDFQRLAYQVDGIDGVRFEVSEDMIDDRGNTSAEWVFTFMMDKATCALYDWDSMSGRSILSQMQRDCAEFYIAPGIYSQIDSDDVIYHSLYFSL